MGPDRPPSHYASPAAAALRRRGQRAGAALFQAPPYGWQLRSLFLRQKPSPPLRSYGAGQSAFRKTNERGVRAGQSLSIGCGRGESCPFSFATPPPFPPPAAVTVAARGAARARRRSQVRGGRRAPAPSQGGRRLWDSRPPCAPSSVKTSLLLRPGQLRGPFPTPPPRTGSSGLGCACQAVGPPSSLG